MYGPLNGTAEDFTYRLLLDVRLFRARVGRADNLVYRTSKASRDWHPVLAQWVVGLADKGSPTPEHRVPVVTLDCCNNN